GSLLVPGAKVTVTGWGAMWNPYDDDVLQLLAQFGPAQEMAEKEKDPTRKTQLEEIARTCERVPANPPQTFMEAVQFFYFIHLVRYLEYSTLGIGLRVDYILGSFYERDLKEGRITRDEALEILELLWVKFLELGLVYSHTGLQKFVHVVGAARTRELFLVGRNVDAGTALAWG
ncbi:MAG: hypothetical protein JJE15_16650, partial [Desulfobacteraceae bacterium]|nr:hypothetical protein [Desulfobacteraceae bacterium]